jgi:hypothetical protein
LVSSISTMLLRRAAGSSSRLLFLCVTMQMLGSTLAGLNATWIAPTPGCSSTSLYATCNREQVCAPSYIISNMGDVVRFTLAATNPTVGFTTEAVQHCNNPGTRLTCSPTYIQVRVARSKQLRSRVSLSSALPHTHKLVLYHCSRLCYDHQGLVMIHNDTWMSMKFHGWAVAASNL